MKKTILVISVIMAGLVSFALHRPDIESEQKMGLQVIAALQRGSAHEFSALFPTLADFHGLMLRNSELYGKNLEEASKEFQKEFESVLSPSFRSSFEAIRQEGISKGIDWRAAKLISVEVPENLQYEYSLVPVTIVFQAGKDQYRLRIERAFVISGRWKISQYMHFEK